MQEGSNIEAGVVSDFEDNEDSIDTMTTDQRRPKVISVITADMRPDQSLKKVFSFYI